MWKVCFILAGSLAMLPAQVSGFLKTYLSVNPNQSDRWAKVYSHFQLQFSGEVSPRVAYRADLITRYDFLADRGANAPRNAGLEFYPAELYLDYYADLVDLRVGQQYLFWGRADWVNPTDRFIPWDYQRMSSDIEDYRLPIPAVKADIYLSWGGAWQFIYAPLNYPDRTPFPWSQAVTDSSLQQGQWGLRFSNDRHRLAYSFYFYQGKQKSPEFLRMNFTSTPPEPEFSYRDLTMFGADFIYPGEHWALKGEGAYNKTEDQKGQDPFIENNNFYGVLGLDWLPNEWFTLTIQGILKQYFQYSQAKDQDSIQTLGAAHYSEAPPSRQFSFSPVLRWKVMNYLQVQIIGVLHFAERDWFLLPFLSWEVADGTHLTLGGIFFEGPEGSPFGNSAESDELFLEIKTSF